MAELATDPPVSEAQRRAMYAARAGRSTLGIPKSVGEEFVGKDMAPADWDGLVRGLLKFLAEEAEEPEHAEDEAMALDKNTVRSYDKDGRLRIDATNISKATVNPYIGREVPDWENLGLDPDRVYKFLRDPEELKKAAQTFNGVQLLIKHVPVNADDHQPDKIVGTTGTDAVFEAPYLRNSLSIWAREGIDAVESDEQKELSCGYYWRADMTPGTYEGQNYDGVMRDIVGNHVALVKEGRAGSDVVVGDEKPTRKELTNMQTVLSRKATYTAGVLSAYLMPKLALDAKVDLTGGLKGITAKNFKAKQPILQAYVLESVKGKLAKDDSIDVKDLGKILDLVESSEIEEGIDADPNTGLPMAALPEPKAKDAEEPWAKTKEFLKGKVGEDVLKACDELMAKKAMDETPEEKKKREDEEAAKKAGDKAKDEEPKVTKAAMDIAISAATKKATEDAIRTQREIRDAEEAVRPFVGALAMAHDSAEGVYRTALTTLGLDEKEMKTLPLPALKAVLKAQPVPGSRPPSARIAQDESATKSFATRFPGADRISNA